ncbi:DedA family protein [Solicola gregarius]|uniref:VTT domain-containing protein n=1 Tax=Solicola gregarius TaxID=2908642 RepID=A0AA46TGU4_9ACTN|nr:VTT domain-containing protein [Solicola gregarius]UYM04547.1 VTT domain-containing protein [Solicola gregarius]
MNDATTLTFGYLVGMFGIVAFGSFVPVLPTGAAVSVAAVLAEHNVAELALVVAVGAAAAYVGDIATFAVLSRAGASLAQRVGWLSRERPAERLAQMRAQVEQNEMPALMLSRLLPAGRIPVLLAAAIGGYPWRRYVSADVGAVILWAAVYAAIGVVGGSIFSHPWEAVAAAMAGVVAFSLLAHLVRRFVLRS